MYLNLNIYNTSPVSAGLDTSICFGESITLNAIGNGTLSWNNGVTNGQSFVLDSTRLYVAQLINSYGCISNDSVTITVLNLPNIDAGSDIISKQIRILRENKSMTNISFLLTKIGFLLLICFTNSVIPPSYL